jgi:hypothetical protein
MNLQVFIIKVQKKGDGCRLDIFAKAQPMLTSPSPQYITLPLVGKELKMKLVFSLAKEMDFLVLLHSYSTAEKSIALDGDTRGSVFLWSALGFYHR